MRASVRILVLKGVAEDARICEIALQKGVRHYIFSARIHAGREGLS